MQEAPRKRFSASRLSTWMNCSLQAKFIYKDRLVRQQNAYATFGSCVHHALKVYNDTGKVQLALDTFTDVWDNPEKIDCKIDVWPAGINYGGARQRGITMIRGYHEKMEWQPRDVVATEHKFLVPMGKFDLTGYVDLLDVKRSGRGKDTLRVVDFKTNKRQPFRDSLSLNVQFTCYLWAVNQSQFWLGNGPEFPPMDNGDYWWTFLENTPKRGIWYHLEGQKEMDVGDRDEADFMRFYRVLQMIDRAEEHDVYVPDISGDTCGLCSFTAECGVKIPENTEDQWI